MSEKPESWTAIDAFVWPHIAANLIREQRAEIERLTADNERLRDELRQSSIDITRAEIERLRGLLTEARAAKWIVVQDNLLDRIDTALRRGET